MVPAPARTFVSAAVILAIGPFSSSSERVGILDSDLSPKSEHCQKGAGRGESLWIVFQWSRCRKVGMTFGYKAQDLRPCRVRARGSRIDRGITRRRDQIGRAHV